MIDALKRFFKLLREPLLQINADSLLVRVTEANGIAYICRLYLPFSQSPSVVFICNYHCGAHRVYIVIFCFADLSVSRLQEFLSTLPQANFATLACIAQLLLCLTQRNADPRVLQHVVDSWSGVLFRFVSLPLQSFCRYVFLCLSSHVSVDSLLCGPEYMSSEI